MFKFAVKVGLATAAVYYINEQGIWKNSSESVRALEKLKVTVNPYVEDVKSQIPFELPTLPESNKLSSIIKESWNAGVLTTFKFISDLPQIVNHWSKKGYEKAMENKDLKDFVDSFSAKEIKQKK